MTVNVGFIGPGIMGGPMALNLMKGGHKLWVYARRPEATQALVKAGATACTTAMEVAKHADVIFLIVSDTPDVDSVIFGETGLAAGISKGVRNGCVIVDMSTISPTATRRRASMSCESRMRSAVTSSKETTRSRAPRAAGSGVTVTL